MQSIRDIAQKIKGRGAQTPISPIIETFGPKLFVFSCSVLVVLALGGLYRLYRLEGHSVPVRIETRIENTATSSPGQISSGEPRYVGSKTTGKFYLPWCGGVSRAKEENKVWFITKEQALAAGYVAATNCGGL